MSETLDYIADLERENRLLKSFLYCTKRSCNNCGKVNCENFQRQRIDCCGLWVSYKDYIKQQEGQIADIKANCDLAIEGRDVKIKELEKENAELRNNGFTVSAMTEQQLKVAIEKGEQLEKENAELKDQLIKAKEHIKQLLGCLKQDTNDPQTNYYVCQYMDKAEQFLKEIEK